MVQCFCNTLISFFLMHLKTRGLVDSLESIGMKISTPTEAYSKLHLGVKMGLANLCIVIFSVSSVKYVNLPVYESILLTC